MLLYILEYRLHLSHFFAPQLGVIMLPFVSKSREDSVRQQYRKAKAPDQSNGVEEVGVARAGVNPEMIERGTQESGVE